MIHNIGTKPVQDPKELNDIQKSFYDSMPDYTKFANGGDLLDALKDDGMKWAAAFCQITKKRFDIDLDLMYVHGWMANAIEYSNDVRRWKAEEAAKNPPAESDEPWVKMDFMKTVGAVNTAQGDS
jgi:hypothetical protein